LEPILPMYRVGVDLEALELTTSIVNHCVLSILNATLFATPNRFKQEPPP
jgi:hypothetical protein